MKIRQLFVIFSKIRQLDYLPIVNSNNQIEKFIHRKNINPTINKFGNDVLVKDVLDSLLEKEFIMTDFMQILNQKNIDSIFTLEENSFNLVEYSLEQFKINFYLVEKIDNFKEIFNLYTLPVMIVNTNREVIFINQQCQFLLDSWKISAKNPLDFFSKEFLFYTEKNFHQNKNNFYHDIDYEKLKRSVYTKQLLPLSKQGKILLITIISTVKINLPAKKKQIEKKETTIEKHDFYSL